MSEGSNGLGCPLKLWIVSAVIGAAVALAFVAGGYAWLAAIFLGVVTCGLIGMFLTWLICVSPQQGTRRQAAFGAQDPLEVVEIAQGEVTPEHAAAPVRKPAPQVEAAPEPAAVAAAKPETPAAPKSAPQDTGAEASDEEGTKPEILTAARAGGADDLRKIKGIGPRLETMLNEMGFYHYDQIAAWGAGEITWVDARLKFKGRIVRDDWVAQAAKLASEGRG